MEWAKRAHRVKKMPVAGALANGLGRKDTAGTLRWAERPSVLVEAKGRASFWGAPGPGGPSTCTEAGAPGSEQSRGSGHQRLPRCWVYGWDTGSESQVWP